MAGGLYDLHGGEWHTNDKGVKWEKSADGSSDLISDYKPAALY